MASTNKTTHYELSQFLGTDKPAWLTDYNADMSKIDTAINTAQSTATGADGKANANTTSIGTLANLTTEDKTSLVAAINEVDSHADTAQETANNAVGASTSNTELINQLSAYLNINTFDTPTLTFTNATSTSYDVGTSANSTGSLGKVYGAINFTSTGTSHTITFPTLLRPNSAISINGLVFAQYDDSRIIMPTLNIATDGVATISLTGSTSGRIWRIKMAACVLFAKSFGDTIITD